MDTVGRKKKIRKICSLWIHDKNFSENDVVFNLSKFPELELSPGSLAKVTPVGPGVSVRDFQQKPASSSLVNGSASKIELHDTSSDAAIRRERRGSFTVTVDESGAQVRDSMSLDCQRAYVFAVQDASADLKSKYPNLCMSVSSTIAAVFRFRNRMQVVVTKADFSHWASHVEISFRDEYLARADMWRLVVSELANRPVYKDQQLLFMGTIKATVKHVYRDGQKRKSGFFAANSKPIFRSESARYVLFIQMSKEMWDFDVEGSGEIMFNKVINGFLPDLFKKWSAIHARHLVTIVLFTRIEYEKSLDGTKINTERSTETSQDFYRVVVSDMASGDWIKILYQLKKEFRTFLRDVTVNCRATNSAKSEQQGNSGPESIIAGSPSSAAKGNILEAITLASAQYSKDYIDRDLVRTGISIVVITAGTGVFDVDYSMLKLTTDNLIGSGIGLDLVSLSPMPLHSVPLFRYRNPRITNASLSTSLSRSYVSDDTVSPQTNGVSDTDDGWRYAMPHWVDISFWASGNDEETSLMRTLTAKKPSSRIGNAQSSAFNLRCRLYELQMMGIMENEMSNISVDFLHKNEHHPWHKLKNEITGLPVTKVDRSYLKKLDRAWMDEYDEETFAAESIFPETSDQPGETPQSDQMQPANDKQTVNKRPHHAERSESSPMNRSNFLEWSFRANSSNRHLAARRKLSNASLTSNASSVAPVAGKFSRQISFSSGGFGAMKAVPTTDLTLALSSTEGPTFSKEAAATSSNDSRVKSDFTKKIKASLNMPSGRPTTQASASSKTTEFSGDARSQPIAIGKVRPGDRTRTPEVVGSQDTIREIASSVKAVPRPEPVDSRDSGAILYAASATQRVGPKLGVSTSDDAPQVLKTLSPTSALAPWLVLVNPSNPKKNNFNLTSQFRRWQHVFPKPLRTSSIKWKSLCSPASVPLTNEYFPTAVQLSDEYQESPYNISPDAEDSNLPPSKIRENLVRELISARLSHGFQFIVGASAAQFLGAPVDDLSKIFEQDYMSRDGSSVLMSVGNTIHQITCAVGNEVEIRRFNRKSPAGMESTAGKPFTMTYKPYIRTALAKDYDLVNITLKPPRLEYNWNFIDQFLAGYRPDFSDALRFWRARFVLIPVNLPKNRNTLSVHAEDTAEELRLEGIYKLTQIWQRNRVWDEEQRVNLRSKKTKDANPLAIEYQTRDPSVVVSAPPDSNALLPDQDGAPFTTQLFNEKEPYETANIDLVRLAHDLQGDHGIRMLDRRWHWRLHFNCFVGFDLTSWLLQNFRDISVREEAVELGNQLMEKGLFQHVQKKHAFRDGQYFYQIASDYRINRSEPRTGWFRSGRADKSIPATPLSDVPKTPLSGNRSISKPSTSSSSSSGEKTPTKEAEGKRKVQLSRSLRYDLDPRKRSYRPEIINLHYDRLHNPDNCYHIRIDWMNVTAKLIEDHIVQWATTVERYGLKLVEVPIGEASSIATFSAFRSPYIVRLAEAPPPTPTPAHYFDTVSFMPHVQSDKFIYHKALLRKLDFLQDIEAASCFPDNVDVTYSWGRPDYRYTQYIHKSGVLLVQILDDGDFLLLANRLYNNRAAAVRDVVKFDKPDAHDAPAPRRVVTSTVHAQLRDRDPGRWSPTASPLVRASATAEPPLEPRASTDQNPDPSVEASHRTAEQLKDRFESHCKDASWLRAFYAEALRPRVSPSPRLAPVPDESIPSLGLPPTTLSSRTLSQSPVAFSRSGRESAASRLGGVDAGSDGGSPLTEKNAVAEAEDSSAPDK